MDCHPPTQGAASLHLVGCPFSVHQAGGGFTWVHLLASSQALVWGISPYSLNPRELSLEVGEDGDPSPPSLPIASQQCQGLGPGSPSTLHPSRQAVAPASCCRSPYTSPLLCPPSWGHSAPFGVNALRREFSFPAGP